MKASAIHIPIPASLHASTDAVAIPDEAGKECLQAWPRRLKRVIHHSVAGILLSVLAGGVWLAALGCRALKIHRFEFTAGTDAPAPARWPAATGIAPSIGQPTLLVFAHPRCPCTAATLDQLAEIAAKTAGGCAIRVVFFAPESGDVAWTGTASVQQARAIPGARVLVDENGREATLFHAATSGKTLLYNSAGELLFDGGITGSRGSSADNPGTRALLALLNDGRAQESEHPIFGCPIFCANSSVR